MYISVIPAVFKPESSLLTGSGCPITDLGHDRSKKTVYIRIPIISLEKGGMD
jgi:hypothetical protein